MSAGAVRAALRTTQSVRLPRPLTRYTTANALSPFAGPRRYQSTVAEIHDAGPSTIPQTGIQTGTLPARGGGGSLLATQRGQPAGGPMARHEMLVQQGRLREDSHQKAVVGVLQKLYGDLLNYKPQDVLDQQPSNGSALLSSWFNFRARNKEPEYLPAMGPSGLYLWGDVGCGKTMLMDMLYDTLPATTHKTRVHFHAFMLDIHKQAHAEKLRNPQADPLPVLTARLAENTTILFLDEFQVTDIADAMILRRLLTMLLARGMVLITTSNRHPRDLYRNGIQRESFIPAIELLQSRLRVINLDSPTDYRKIPRPSKNVYFSPLNEASRAHANKWFEYFGGLPPSSAKPAEIELWGRKLAVPSALGTCARFTFHDLCGLPLGAADYVELCRRYKSFVVTDVPKMSFREKDLARRFIVFIDGVYESKAKIVLTSEVPIAEIFSGEDPVKLDSAAEGEGEQHGHVDSGMRSLMDDLGISMDVLLESSIFSGEEEQFAFARALSRLVQMGSEEWVESGIDCPPHA